MSDTAKEIIAKQESYAKDRSTTEEHWSDAARYVFPRGDDFFNSRKTPGERRTRNRYDDTAVLALDRFAAAMEHILTPRGSIWHRLENTTDGISDDHEVKTWLDNTNKYLFNLRYGAFSNFASQMHECYLSLGVFGTSVLIVEDVIGKGIRYKSSHVSEHFLSEDLHGRINRNYRLYKLTALQAAEKFGESLLSEATKRAMEKNPSEKFDFIHAVIPNEEDDGLPFKSFHVQVDGQKLLSVGGFKTFPYIASRYVTSPGECYGRSVAMSSLAEIKMLNSMRKTDLKSRHMAVDPPHLAASQATIRKFNLKPNAMNYGALDDAGNPLVRPYQSGANISVSNDVINQSREFINDTFLVTLFQILVDSPAMTATEVLQRAQEKGALLSPAAGRQQSELLGPLINREVSLLEEYGLFEDGAPLALPEALKGADDHFGIEYTSPIAKMQKAEEGLSTQRTIEAMLPMAQFAPELIERIDWNEYASIMRESNGAPQRLFLSDDVVLENQARKEEAAQQQQLMQSIPDAAGAIKDIAQAESFSE